MPYGLFPILSLLWASTAMVAGAFSVQSDQVRMTLAARDAKPLEVIHLPNGSMLVIKVAGPTHLGLRLRQVFKPPRTPLPVDLTVVRDDAAQATVRFKTPVSDGAGLVEHSDWSLSGQLLVKIEVPEGEHLYRLLATGPENGVLLAPFTGRLADSVVAVLATPGEPGQVRLPPTRITTREPRLPTIPEPDLLADVATAGPVAETIKSRIILHRPEPPSRFGPLTRVSAGLGGMLLVGAGAAAVAGAVQEGRADSSAVQTEAYATLGHADRAYETSAVLAGVGAAALLAAVICYLVEEP